MRLALYLVFLFSGAAGLIYESIWSRYLGLFVGHSAYAQVLVITIFLGGMSVGALIVGRWTVRLREPLLAYAAVEVGIGLMGLAFHPTFVGVTNAAYDSLFPALTGSAAGQLFVKWSLAALLILPQSILLGTTFPLISAGVLRRAPGQSGRALGWLYASNSFGAAVGVLVAGFYLVARLGFPGTLAVAAYLNLALAVVTAGLVVVSRRSATAAPVVAQAAVRSDPIPNRRLLLAVAFGTAVASFVYEIAWLRMLSLVLGSATHSFELMLSAFILGLSLGALWVRSRADLYDNPIRTLGIVQCVMGALALATIPPYLASFGWMSELMATFARTDQGYLGFNVGRYLICAAIMLPATFCAGMTLPLITRTLYRGGADERAIGEVYSINTAGSIVGVQLAGMVLLPLLGLRLLLITGAALDIAFGLALLRAAAGTRAHPWRTFVLATTAATVVIVGFASMTRFDRELLTSGVFRDGEIAPPHAFKTTFYRDGRTASVSINRSLAGDLVLATNGKPDASLRGTWFTDEAPAGGMRLSDDDATQVLIPVVSLAHARDAKTVAVIGHGSGMTSHVLLGSPRLRELVTIEIEPQMIRAAAAFYPLNRRAYEDPRSRFVIDDAKAYLAAADRRFDLIVSEPSNPWVSGVSGLFTAEFYARVRQYLAPDGVFAQWLHLYELNDSLVRSVLAAIQATFSDYQVFLVGDTDVLVVATRSARLRAPDWSIVRDPMIAADLRRIIPFTADALDALRISDKRGLAPFVTTARANSDFAPLLDLGAERARYLSTDAAGLRMLNLSSFDIAAALSERRVPFTDEIRSPFDVPRVTARVRAARLRAARRGSTTAVDDDPELVAAIQRRRAHDAVVASGRAPESWRAWGIALYHIDRDVHAGTAGVVDEALFAPLPAYLRSARAPREAHELTAFLRAMDAWDFETAVRSGTFLLEVEDKGTPWIDRDYLRDGLVVGRLRLGDPKGALDPFNRLLPKVRRDPGGTFRTRLLGAHIAAAIGRRTQRTPIPAGVQAGSPSLSQRP